MINIKGIKTKPLIQNWSLSREQHREYIANAQRMDNQNSNRYFFTESSVCDEIMQDTIHEDNMISRFLYFIKDFKSFYSGSVVFRDADGILIIMPAPVFQYITEGETDARTLSED